MTNSFNELLSTDLVKFRMEADSKTGIIKEFIEMFDQAGLLKDRQAAESAILERESIMSTGMELGIAIPHGKTDSVDKLITAVGLRPEGLDFDCMDGNPATIFVATLSPASSSGPHIRFMASITGLLHDEDFRNKLLNSVDQNEMFNLLTKDH